MTRPRSAGSSRSRPRSSHPRFRTSLPCYSDGKIIPQEIARIPVLDSAFREGAGVFETVRIYRGRAPTLTRHLERLGRSASIARLPLPEAEIGRACGIVSELAECPGVRGRDLVARLQISRSDGDGRPRLRILLRPVPPGQARLRLTGATAALIPINPPPDPSLHRAKCSSRLEHLAAEGRARSQEAEWAIWTDHMTGAILEATGANLFALSDGCILTPPLSAGILPGVTRGLVIETCRRIGFEVRETEVHEADLAHAEEVFLTNTVIEVLPIIRISRIWESERIKRIGDAAVGDGKPGPFARKIFAGYRALLQGL